jgi:single-strand DNA-binding protein
MGSRSVNMAILIGNLTRDPEMRYTPSGSAVTTFGIATNREWTDSAGTKQEAADFHNIVCWGKLAELCNQLLKKGRKVYVKGRLSTSTWEGSDGQKRNKTEVVIDEMVILDSRRESDESGSAAVVAKTDMSSAKANEDVSSNEISEAIDTPEKAQDKKDKVKAEETEGEKAPF